MLAMACRHGAQLSLDEAGQFTASAGLNVRDETGRMLLHQAVQRGLLGAVARVPLQVFVHSLQTLSFSLGQIGIWTHLRPVARDE